MAQSYKTIHDFQSLNVSDSLLSVTRAGTGATLGSLQSGNLITLNSTTGSLITLPAPTVGFSFPFVVAALGAHTITAPTSTLFGAINCAVPTAGSTLNVCSATGSSVLLTTAGSSIGDRITIVSDGVNYYISGTVAHFNSIKFA